MIANTWGAVYRDGDTDVLGDPLTAEAAVAGLERVPMAITEKSRKVYDAESDELRTLRWATGRAIPGTDIRPDDRIKDLRSGRWWAVQSVGSGAPGFTGHQDLSFDLRAA